MPFPGSHRSPIWALFKNKPKYALFWQTDELKSSRRGLFQPRSHAKRAIDGARKKRLPDGRYCPLKGIIWALIWAYFCKQDDLNGLNVPLSNRGVFRGYFGWFMKKYRETREYQPRNPAGISPHGQQRDKRGMRAVPGPGGSEAPAVTDAGYRRYPPGGREPYRARGTGSSVSGKSTCQICLFPAPSPRGFMVKGRCYSGIVAAGHTTIRWEDPPRSPLPGRGFVTVFFPGRMISPARKKRILHVYAKSCSFII